MAPWQGPRHRSWASNTVLSTVALFALLATTLIIDYFGEPPTYLTGLLGTAAGAWFAAIGSDKQKKDTEVADTADRANATAERAEAKADTLADVATREHPEETPLPDPPFDSGQEKAP